MSQFSVGGTSCTFIDVQEGYSSRAGLLEEKHIPLVVDSSAEWGALFSLVTPRDLVSVRACRGAAGAVTIKVDVGGGAGAGTLILTGIDTWTALLVELQDEPPEIGTGRRLCQAVFLITAGG